MVLKLTPLALSICAIFIAKSSFADDVNLPSIQVSTEQNNANAYLQKNSSSATKTNTALQDTPQSVSVVSQGVLTDLGASRLIEALDVAGGVGRSNNFGAQGLTKYTTRGFSSGEFYRNGFPINRGYPAAPDSSNIDRVDVIRGPSSAMYGRSDPSGTFNIVSKQPLKENQTVVGIQGNQYGTYRGTLDTTGAINQDKSLTYRLNVAGEGGSTFRDDVHVKRYDISPVLQWQPTDQTKVTFEADFLRNQQPYDKGFTNYPGQNYPQFSAKTYFWQTGKDVNRLDSANDLYQFRVEHQLNSDWTLNFGAQYINGGIHGFGLEPRGFDQTTNNLLVGYSWRKLSWTDKDLQASLTGKFNLWGMQHTLLTGIEYEDYDYKARIDRNGRGANLSLNPLNPNYSQTLPTLINPFYNERENLTSYAAFIQDQVDLTAKLKALMSLRFEHYQQDHTTDEPTAWSKNTNTVLPRVGLSYAVTPEWSLYGNISTSFYPIHGENSNGQANDPEKGLVYELGSKWQLLDDKLSVQSAIYYTKKKNVLSAALNSQGETIYETIGAATSKGFELNLAGQITPAWKVIGGYAYTDAKITKDGNANNVGQPLDNIPKNSFNLLSIYEFQSKALSGLGVGINQKYISQRYGKNDDVYFKMKGYSVTDALAYYKVNDQLRFNLDVKNIFNKRYDESSYMLFSYPGEPRTVQLGATYRF
ncbi:TonB-dependent receptor [Acinetobacter sp. MD2(2019)]|uniref:TonB-dependent siderophore receptor n=1 Tax=Acinetobacter sp. MD2(2019) TaxID=2605273 RepID=UPI002D1E5798|nr:TonB-dependent receptor [Acinetobacter sp. MD2(2019)]MEB3753526.1 TonB-dependent receptor [Acinetobacter sp. MD2(2019)]